METTAVVVVRDDYARLHGNILIHNENLTHALLEDFHAKKFDSRRYTAIVVAAR